MRKQKHTPEPGRLRRLRTTAGIAGCIMAGFFFVWLALGIVPGVPNMIEVFGMTGMRIPASITIAGLLLAAVGFYEP